MNPEQLRKQAKKLVKPGRAGDQRAPARLGGREPILARAQLVGKAPTRWPPRSTPITWSTYG
jgi:hypothetical protein